MADAAKEKLINSLNNLTCEENVDLLIFCKIPEEIGKLACKQKETGTCECLRVLYIRAREEQQLGQIDEISHDNDVEKTLLLNT